jgi:hypothetical protein
LADVLGGLTGSNCKFVVTPIRYSVRSKKNRIWMKPGACILIASSSASMSTTRLSGSMSPHLTAVRLP